MSDVWILVLAWLAIWVVSAAAMVMADYASVDLPKPFLRTWNAIKLRARKMMHLSH